MFPKNVWYVACSSNEVQDKPLGRQICGDRIVFYRKGDGTIAALEDYCPHRGAPLSLGTVKDDNLVCGYHGLSMGADGVCAGMANQRVNGFPRLRTYPIIEENGFVWIWPGDQDASSASRPPTFEWASSPDWAYGGHTFRLKCDYRLMIDNLMDLTHETHVHASSIGQREIEEVPPKTEVDGDTVTTSRLMEGIMPPPFWAAALRAKNLADDVPCDRWQICRYTPPSHVMIEAGVAHSGKGGYVASDADKVTCVVVDFITPESDGSMWYFLGLARTFSVEDQALTDSIRGAQAKIFAEDLLMLEAQHENHVHWNGRPVLKLNIDSGGVQSRRVLERLVEQEQSA
ncbi:aromatic ring-hydroxylating dioxygenase subunit alpha [Pandoraea pnomenusa]|uniref:aromatic ring-hydroxylating dioxygenase subunit alpha n=1 Tax=Pandoraea pnomenusa TaxID=93220 RepID=UPI003340110C